jgi:galacturonosyltransferase
MRIVLFEGDLNNAITGFRKDLVKQLSDSGFEVVLVGFRVYKDGFGLVEKKDISNKILDLGHLSLNPFLIIKAFINFFLFLLVNRPSLCLAFNIRPIFFLGLINFFLRIPSIGTITGTSTISNGKSLNRPIKIISRFLLRFYKVLVFQNSHDKDLFSFIKLFKVKVKIIPGSGVDTKYFSKEFVDDYCHMDNSDFLLIARIIKQKGISEYIEAARQIKKSNPNLIFGLLGPFYFNSKDTNTILPEFIELAEKEGIIKYFGFSKNVRKYLLSSKCIVLPTYGEGMSNTLLEAASLERPILASNVPGCREIVDHGVNGFLFEKQSVTALIEAFNRFLLLSEADKVRMGVLGRIKIIKEFDKSIVVSSYLEEVELVINSKSKLGLF